MFTPEERRRLKEALLGRAREDERVVGAALLGSSAGDGEEDRWSDIDLALSVRAERLEAAIEDWTTAMYRAHRAVHHFDVRWRKTLYRVFLLVDTLQVDLSFWPSEEFVATGPRFRSIFGSPPVRETPEKRSDEALIGEAWLYLLHARSSLARARHWQANYMIAKVRDAVLELACRRHGLRADEARGVDDLPPALLDAYASMVPRAPTAGNLRDALGAASACLLAEARQAHPQLADRIAPTLEEIGTVA